MKTLEFCYFSPTGGTKKTGAIFCNELADQVRAIDIGAKQDIELDGDFAVIAAPVFGGRIPALVTDKLNKLDGAGKTAVTLAVYGTRAYEDALLELNDTLMERGFNVVASGAFVAQHSMAAAIGQGRPDEEDAGELRRFARYVSDKLEKENCEPVRVPGNRPYKQQMVAPTTPVVGEGCRACGACVRACPTGAVALVDGKVETDGGKCVLCLTCTAVCPAHVRVLPQMFAENIARMLAPLRDVRRANEYYL